MALKFCGGCNPAYERTEYWQAINQAAAGRIEWVRMDDQGYVAVLLICGCATTCPVTDMPSGVRVICMSLDDHHPGAVVSRLLEKE